MQAIPPLGRLLVNAHSLPFLMIILLCFHFLSLYHGFHSRRCFTELLLLRPWSSSGSRRVAAPATKPSREVSIGTFLRSNIAHSFVREYVLYTARKSILNSSPDKHIRAFELSALFMLAQLSTVQTFPWMQLSSSLLSPFCLYAALSSYRRRRLCPPILSSIHRHFVFLYFYFTSHQRFVVFLHLLFDSTDHRQLEHRDGLSVPFHQLFSRFPSLYPSRRTPEAQVLCSAPMRTFTLSTLNILGRLGVALT